MKKYLLVFLLLAVLITVTGCSMHYEKESTTTVKSETDLSNPAGSKTTITKTTTTETGPAEVPTAPTPEATTSGADTEIFNGKTCEWDPDCRDDSEYTTCVIGHCAKPVKALQTYLEANFHVGTDCGNIECEGCKNGRLVGSTMEMGEVKIDYCPECDSDDGMFTCNEGYTCNMGKCIQK